MCSSLAEGMLLTDVCCRQSKAEKHTNFSWQEMEREIIVVSLLGLQREFWRLLFVPLLWFMFI